MTNRITSRPSSSFFIRGLRLSGSSFRRRTPASLPSTYTAASRKRLFFSDNLARVEPGSRSPSTGARSLTGGGPPLGPREQDVLTNTAAIQSDFMRQDGKLLLRRRLRNAPPVRPRVRL